MAENPAPTAKWQFWIDRGGTFTDVVPAPGRASIGTEADPVMLEVFNNLFMSIAEQMGLVPQNTSYSVNIKERLDFSCAVFDADGDLVANGPHIPVHLGSMSESVQTILELRRDTMKPGDVFVIETPGGGGFGTPETARTAIKAAES